MNFTCIFIFVDMSFHSDTLSWFRSKQSLLFFLNAACLAEKQQIPISYSLICPNWRSNPWYTALEATTLTITPLIRFVWFDPTWGSNPWCTALYVSMLTFHHWYGLFCFRESICDVCGECHDVDFDEDYDVLLSKYNVPDPDPRIGFSNDNVQHASTITGHFPRLPIQDRSDDLETIGRSTTTDLRRSSRRRNRRPSRRRERSTRRRGASRQQKCIEICVA